jgi:hypothetical protein
MLFPPSIRRRPWALLALLLLRPCAALFSQADPPDAALAETGEEEEFLDFGITRQGAYGNKTSNWLST